jgi:hypothetical protein
MTRTVQDLGSVDHACAAPVSDEQLWEITAEWLAGGLTSGERVLYFEDETADAVLERLADDGIPVQRAISDGQLTIALPCGGRPSSSRRCSAPPSTRRRRWAGPACG